MSDADYSPHEGWCDTQNQISKRCNCMASKYIEKLEQERALRLAAEKELDKLKKDIEIAGDYCAKMVRDEITKEREIGTQLRIAVDKANGIIAKERQAREAAEQSIEACRKASRETVVHLTKQLKVAESRCAKLVAALEGLSKEVMVFPDIKNAQGWVSADMVKRWLDKARRAIEENKNV